MKKILLALILAAVPSAVWAQCSGVFPPNTYCGNNTGSPAIPSAVPGTSAGTVNGPGSSTSGDIGVWNNTLGTLLKDVPPLQIFGTIGNNLFLSGPTSGGPLNPTFRGITAADLPTNANPTTQVFLNGSGTYSTPALVKWIELELQGGGGGGSGSGTGVAGNGGNGGNTCWNTSGAACTSPVYQAGGGVGAVNDANLGGAGGTLSGTGTCFRAIPGGSGSAAAFASNDTTGGAGGSGALSGGGGGASGSAQNGNAGATNSGGGGGGAGSPVNGIPGNGGGAGANCRAIIGGPAATYTYAVGAAGTGGTAGTSGGVGGAGASGGIWVIEHYAP